MNPKSFLLSLQELTENYSKSLQNAQKRNMSIRYQKTALDVSYGFDQSRSMFLIVVFLIKKRVWRGMKLGNSITRFRHESGNLVPAPLPAQCFDGTDYVHA